MGKNNYDVFISYSRKDKEFISMLTRFFEVANVSFFLDEVDIEIYSSLKPEIKENISKSKYVVSVISQNYLTSYWCMFEAIETIESTKLNKKFLPIVIKYNENDKEFDEDFVFEKLEELTIEIANFEDKMIRHKAYDLTPKLEKLSFIKKSLPKIFSEIQKEVYPEFFLWDKHKIKNSLNNIIKYINKEDLAIDETLIPDFVQHVLEEQEFKTILPGIKWSTYIGKQTWKNTPLIIGSDIFVGSAGKKWNEADEYDGVYCLDFYSGRVKWFFKTNSDVNEIMFSDGLIFGGCDNGFFFCISSRTGELKWNKNFESGVVTKPIKITGFNSDIILIGIYTGRIYQLNILDGAIEEEIILNNRIMGNVAKSCSNNDYNLKLYIPTIDGYIYILSRAFGGKIIVTNKLLIEYPDKFSESGFSSAELYSEPLIHGNKLIQCYSRQTYYEYPPINNIDLENFKVNWIGKDGNSICGDFGNIRTKPILYKNEIIVIFPYSNELIGISITDGLVKWKITLGRHMFQQWSSPICIGKYLYIARHDGYFHKIDLEKRERMWTIYLGENSDSGFVLDMENTLSDKENEVSTWSSYKGYSILSTPCYSKNNVIIGTDEGYLYCLGNV